MNLCYTTVLVIISFSATLTSGAIENVKCSRLAYERCLNSVIDDVFNTSTNSEHCNSNGTVPPTCVQTIQYECSHLNSPTISAITTPYIDLLHKIYGLSCESELISTDCDSREAVTCIKHLYSSLTSASVGAICRQTTPALKCLTPVKNKCSGVYRYVIALITEELRLTSDLWCSHTTCNIDIADHCIHEARRSIAYPTTVVMGSNLVCSDVRYALTCISNHTEVCPRGAVPQQISDGFMQLFQFSTAYCGTSSVYTIPFDIGTDLSPSVILGKISTNRWTKPTDICKMFNETMELAAMDKHVSSTSNLENMFMWQNAMGLVVDRFADFCFQSRGESCDWISRLANENPLCDVTMATSCVDKVVLSKLVVDVYTSRTTWENVCSVAYNMLACAQFYTGTCMISDRSAVLDASQKVERLVGYECSQLGLSGSSDTCQVNKRVCHVSKAIAQCGEMTNDTDACLNKEKIFDCFHENTHDCNSIEASLAQFYMEWLFKDCTHNATLVADDMNTRIAECKLQFGYNMNNGLQTYNAFAPIMCTAVTYYQQCLAGQTLPDMSVAMMKDTDNLLSNIRQPWCNQTNNALVTSGLTESDSCQLEQISSGVALYNNMFHSFPFISLAEQREICRSYPDIATTWSSMAATCTSSRRFIVKDAITFLDNAHDVLCPATLPTTPMSCDLTAVHMCLEDFGAFTYFADPNVDVCTKLEDTYMCLHDNAMGCSVDIQNDLRMEVRAMHAMSGNITCSQSKVCEDNETSSTVPWMNEICTDWNQCSVFGWLSCVEKYNITTSCQFYNEAISCIEASLSGCDPLQYRFARNEMTEWSQSNSPFCNFFPNDPPGLTQLSLTIFECSYYIATTVDVSKPGICTSIEQYLNCLASIEQQDVLYTWRGILGSNVNLWQKHLYLDCRMSDDDQFIVDTDIDLNEVTNTACESLNSQYCLRSYINMAVTYFYLTPLSERQSSVCERSDFYQECVTSQTTGCTNSLARTMLTSVVWVGDAMENVGTCNKDHAIYRECDVTGAMKCVADLGHVLLQDLSSPSLDTVCSQLHSTSVCVNERTSSCSYMTRWEVSQTFNQVAAVVTQVCTTPVSTSTTSCIPNGQMAMCDVEAALVCMVPIQATMMHPNSTLQQVCGSIPEMQTCIHRTTSGCDETTVAMVNNRAHMLSHRLNDRCPEIYCQQCEARKCLTTLNRNMQYGNVDICSLVMETKNCISRYAGYCSPIVGETLLREMMVLVGEDAYMCEITLQACLQTFMSSAYQIIGYTPMQNITTQNDFMLQQLCNEANSAFYCVTQQMVAMDTEMLEVMNSTMHTIGDFVYNKCNQAPSLRCYTCSNTTSYDECYLPGTETCSADKQMCGTFVSGGSIRKGCVEPDMCQHGCTGYMCSMCCSTSLCNEPMDNVITDPPNCQPETTIYCAFQLMFTIAQYNDTMNCIAFQESVACMIQSTQSCVSPGAVSLGLHAREVMIGDVMTNCTTSSPRCTCGECSSMLLLSVIANPFGDNEAFCRSVFEMYNQAMEEMDFNTCSMTSLQTTAYNLQMASNIIGYVCDTTGVDTKDCYRDGVTYTHGSSYMAIDQCSLCRCDASFEFCSYISCLPAGQCPPGQCVDMCLSDDDCIQGEFCSTCSNTGCGHACSPSIPKTTDRRCPALREDEIGTCVEMCTSDNDCVTEEMCCSNGCGHVCTRPETQTNTTVRDCIYGNNVYKSGDSFLATDACNRCFCHDSMVGCTQMYCPSTDNRVCDIVGIQECMNIAGLPYLVSMTTPNNTQHVCLSAANMLKCIESKISSCPPEVVDVVHSAAWWQLDAIHALCDMHTVIWTYLQPNLNVTTPDKKGTCSVNSALHCIRMVSTSHTCSSYEDLIGCVRGYTSGCFSVDMVSVLYELRHYLESSILECNFNIPELQTDFLYPVAECMQSFTHSVSHDTTINHLLMGNFEPLCHSIDMFIQCLGNINDVQPVVRMIAENVANSMTHLVNTCHDLSRQTDVTECYTCQGSSCEDPSAKQCQQNQVCATAVQLDMMTGSTSWTKGCADLQWCHQHHGCNPYTLMCTNCCHGDKCNLEFNMTSTTTMEPTWTTTFKPVTTTTTRLPPTSAATRRPATTTTTATLTTAIPLSCDITYSVTSLMMHTLHLLNFNLLSIVDRQSLCQNYLDTIDHNLDPSCPSDIITHFEMLTERVKLIGSDVCVMFTEQQDRYKKCGEVIQCVANITNFNDKQIACRSFQSAQGCLREHYEYCDTAGQMSINNTIMLLSNMDFVICEPNKLLDGPDVECVAMTMKNSSDAVCNITMATECGAYIHKAMHNPFLQQTDYCRLVKRGMICIRDNTESCEPSMLQDFSQYVGDLVQGIGNTCPDVWCPAEDVCSLDKAWQCLESLQDDITRSSNTDNLNSNICKSLVQTHNCILNNTDNCYTADRQRLIHNFNAISAVADAFCHDKSAYLHQCAQTFHQRLDELINLDMYTIAEVLKTSLRNALKNYILSMEYISNRGDDQSEERLFETDQSESSNVELPELFSYLLTNNQVQGINLPAFLQFLSEINQDQSSGGYGYGLNIPGVYSANTQVTGGLSMPGSRDPVSEQLKHIPKHIKNITNILFGTNHSMSYLDVIREVRIILKLSDAEVRFMMHDLDMSVYTAHKQRHCHDVLDARSCIENSIQWDSFTDEEKYIFETTMGLLFGVFEGICQGAEGMCHSCINLHSNDECNAQPITQCGPFDACQAKVVDSHFYKGCYLKLACEEDCKKTDGECYCCQGNWCNTYSPQVNDITSNSECTIQSAVDSTLDLLMFSLNYTENDRLIQTKATTMVRSTYGCYGHHYRNINTQGQKLLKYLEIKDCGSKSSQDECDVESLNSLMSLMVIPYHSTETLNQMCRLYDQTVQHMLMTDHTCCPAEHAQSMITIYQHINKLCNIQDTAPLQQLCHLSMADTCLMPNNNNSREDNNNSSTTNNDNNNNNNNNNNRDDGNNNNNNNNNNDNSNNNNNNNNNRDNNNNNNNNRNRRDAHSNILANNTWTESILDAVNEGYFCHVLTNITDNKTNSTDEVELHIPSCEFQLAMECFVGDVCRDAEFVTMLDCVNQHTQGCSVVQMVPFSIITRRIANWCNKTDDAAYFRQGINMTSPFECFENLATFMLPSEAGPLLSTACNMVKETSKCIEASIHESKDQLEMVYFKHIHSNMMTFSARVCRNDATEMGTRDVNDVMGMRDVNDVMGMMNDTRCSISTYTGDIIHHLILTLTSAFIHPQDTCMMAKDISTLQENVTACSSGTTLQPLLSWLHETHEVTCLANLALSTCQQSVCDVQRAEELIGHLGYLVSTTGNVHPVFCRKVENVLQGVECALKHCDTNNTSSIHYSMDYVKSVFGTSCFGVLMDRQCDGMPAGMDTSTRPENTSSTESMCNTNPAKMCLYNVLLPSSTDQLRCSKMMAAVEELSECIHPAMAGCHDDGWMEIKSYYGDVFATMGYTCTWDFNGKLFDDECKNIPLCSEMEAWQCITYLDKQPACGNLDDVKQCVHYAMEGCNSMQQFAVMTSLQTYTIMQQLPKSCWENLIMADGNATADDRVIADNSLTGIEHCILSFQQDLYDPSSSGHRSCDMLMSLMTCMEDSLMSPEMLGVVRESLIHLTQVAKHQLQMVCSLEVVDTTACRVDGVIHTHGSSFMDADGCNMCKCSMGVVMCTYKSCPPAEDRQCPAIREDAIGTCVEMCTSDNDCTEGEMCCSNGCGHVCRQSVPKTTDRQCPAIREDAIGTCVEMCTTDGDCTEGEMCCSNGCGHVCIPSVPVPETHSKVLNKSRCNIDAKKSCVMSYATNLVLLPAFSNNVKHRLCNYLDHGMGCVESVVEHCNKEEVQHLHSMTHLLESLAQGSEPCSELPVTCSPELATQCISDLSQAVSQSYSNICWTIGETDTCMKRTLFQCDHSMKEFFMNMYEPIRCRALSLCPTKIDIQYRVTEKLTSCVDPSAIIAHEGTCKPVTALTCLQEAHLPLMDIISFDKHQTCSLYQELLTCFFNNINDCKDDTVIRLAMYHATRTVDRFQTVCGVTIQHGCHNTPTDYCNLDQVETCLHQFINATKFGETSNHCLSKKMFDHCVKYNTEACPRVTRLYTEVKVNLMLDDMGYHDNVECDHVQQCVHDYTTIFDETLKLTESLSDNADDYKQPSDKMMDTSGHMQQMKAHTLFLCHSRQAASSCLTSNIGSMVATKDHADLLESVLYGMDSILVDVCSVLLGLQSEVPNCNKTCVDCLMRRNDYTRMLHMLTSFEEVPVNETDTVMVNSSPTFCQDYELLVAGGIHNESCSIDLVSCGWHGNLMERLNDVHAVYCARECNTSRADTCIQHLTEDINTLNNEKLCLAYNETLQCLEESLQTCDVQVLNEYISVAMEMFNTSGTVCYTLPTFIVGYEASHMTLMEGGAPQSISVTMDTNMADVCEGTSCYIEVFISNDNATFSSCATGDEIPGMLMDTCSVRFSSNDTADSHVIHVYARSDLRTTISQNTTLHIIAQLWAGNVVARESVIATVTMEIVDRDATSECYVISEPYIRTFDGLNYYNFGQGEFVLYQHDTQPEKVHIGFQRCLPRSLSVCPCVVMVQADNDVFVVDTCRRQGESSHAFEFKVYQYGSLSEDVTVYSTNQRKSFDFVLPSGTIVYVRAARQLLDVWVKPSARDWGHTSGLCGTMDGDPDNDLTLPDGTVVDLADVYVWRRVLLPSNFVFAWGPENSLFGGVPVEVPVTEDMADPACVCTNNTCTPTSMTETCGFTTGQDITDQLDLYLQDTNQNRRKRQANDPWNNIDIDNDNDAVNATELPTWPTVNGWTEAIAREACEQALTGHESWDTCSVVMDTSAMVSTCVTNILLTDSVDAIQNAVEDMKSECRMAVLSDPGVSVVLNTTAEELVDYIFNLTCPNDCSNNGQCIDDVCECTAGFGGEDCSLSVEKAPTLLSSSESLFTPAVSTSPSTETRTVIVYGVSFVRSDSLTCQMTTEQGQSSTTKAVFLTGGTILCEVTGTFPYTSLQLSTSNDGVNQSNSLSMIFYDPVCYSCDETTYSCDMQPTSCLLDGVCYSAGDFNPSDNCLLCDPISNDWKFKSSTSCSTTTSSTTESTTVSTTKTSTESTTKSTTPSTTDSSTSQTPTVNSTSSSVSPSTESTTKSTSSSVTPSSSKPTSDPTSKPTSDPTSDPTSKPTSDPTSDPTSGPTSSPSTGVTTNIENRTEGQEEDSSTLTIIIIVAVVVSAVIIIAVIGFALRLRKKDSQQGSVLGSLPSTEIEPPKGKSNPAYAGVERKNPLMQQQRIIPGYSASFDPQGLGPPGVRAVYAEPHYNDVDVGLFEGRRGAAPGESRRVGDVVMEAPYGIPRPVTSTVPASSAPTYVVRLEHDYDNAPRMSEKKAKEASSMPDYYENNDNMSDSSSVRL